MYCSGSPAKRRASIASNCVASISSSPCANTHASVRPVTSERSRSTSRGGMPRRSASSRHSLRSWLIFFVCQLQKNIFERAILLQPRRRSGGDDPPAMNDRHAIAPRLGDRQRVRRQKDRLPFVRKLAHQLPHLPLRERI